MTTADSLDGWWWLHEDDDRVVGRLTVTGRNWSLEVYNDLGDASDRSDPLGLSDQVPEVPVIYGYLPTEAASRRFVALGGAWRTSERSHFGIAPHPQRVETWTFDSISYGPESPPADLLVDEVRVGLSHLNSWTLRRPPRLESADTLVRATATRETLGIAQLRDAEVELVLGCSAATSETDARLTNESWFEVRLSDAIRLADATTDWALPLRSLLAFLTLSHVEISEMTGRARSQDLDQAKWFEYQARFQRPIDDPLAPKWTEMLAPWPRLDLSVDALVSRWFAIQPDLARTITLLLVPQNAPYLFADDHVLTAWLAVEEFHRQRIGGTAVSPEYHKARVDAIVAGSPAEHRSWANDALRGRNVKGLRTQLRDVIARGGATSDEVAQAVDGFEDRAVAARNRVAHPSGDSGADGAPYLAVSYGLRWILRHCILMELGLTSSRAGDIITGCQTFRDELTLMRRWTSQAQH